MLVEDADVVFNLLNHIYTYRVCANIHINTSGSIIFYLPFSPTFLLANYLFIFLICLFVSVYTFLDIYIYFYLRAGEHCGTGLSWQGIDMV